MAESGKVEEDPDHNVKDAAKDFACKIERSKRDFFVRIHDICKKVIFCPLRIFYDFCKDYCICMLCCYAVRRFSSRWRRFDY